MKETLRNLWWGNICPIEEHFVDSNRETKLNLKIENLRKKLKEELTKKEDTEALELLNDLDDMYSNLSSFMQEEGFISGFSLAMRLILEIK